MEYFYLKKIGIGHDQVGAPLVGAQNAYQGMI